MIGEIEEGTSIEMERDGEMEEAMNVEATKHMSLGQTAFSHLTQSDAFLGTSNLKQLTSNKLLNQSGQKSRIEPHLNCQLDHSSVGNSRSFFMVAGAVKVAALG